MSFGRFLLLVFSYYAAIIFLGGALFDGGGLLCAITSWIFFGISLIIYPIFRKKKVEEKPDE